MPRLLRLTRLKRGEVSALEPTGSWRGASSRGNAAIGELVVEAGTVRHRWGYCR